MTVVQYDLKRPLGYRRGEYVGTRVYHVSNTSPRDPRTGKLALQPNAWHLEVTTQQITGAVSQNGSFTNVDFQWHAYPDYQTKVARASLLAQSDLRGKLARRVKNGKVGSLGMSIASAGKSIQMMKGAGASFTRIFESAERFYQTARGRRRLKRLRKTIARRGYVTAGQVLEGFFGWQPLITDFSAAMATLGNPWPEKNWISTKKTWHCELPETWSLEGDSVNRLTFLQAASSHGHATYSCNVSVTNPNLWVGEKLGLVNLAVVAWDRVPWSFLVNMVSNMGQVLGSLSDFAGLGLSGTSLTTSAFTVRTASATWVARYSPTNVQACSEKGTQTYKVKSRQVGVPPPSVVPYLRFPEWGVGQASIVGALLVQQCARLDGAFTKALLAK